MYCKCKEMSSMAYIIIRFRCKILLDRLKSCWTTTSEYIRISEYGRKQMSQIRMSEKYSSSGCSTWRPLQPVELQRFSQSSPHKCTLVLPPTFTISKLEFNACNYCWLKYLAFHSIFYSVECISESGSAWETSPSKNLQDDFLEFKMGNQGFLVR